MTLTTYTELEQGTPEWLAARCGIVTASVAGQLITPKTVKPAANDYSRALTATLVAERLTGYVEPVYANADMQRGTLSEPLARDASIEHHAPVEQVGFMVRQFQHGALGFSPDGLVGEDGILEIKSPRQKKHLATVLSDTVPLEHMAQIQTGLLVSGREWCDFISYCGGMHLFVKRVPVDPKWKAAILEAHKTFEENARQMEADYLRFTNGKPLMERIDFFPEMEFI
jgi:putative phage-type endonuclease